MSPFSFYKTHAGHQASSAPLDTDPDILIEDYPEKQIEQEPVVVGLSDDAQSYPQKLAPSYIYNQKCAKHKKAIVGYDLLSMNQLCTKCISYLSLSPEQYHVHSQVMHQLHETIDHSRTLIKWKRLQYAKSLEQLKSTNSNHTEESNQALSQHFDRLKLAVK